MQPLPKIWLKSLRNKMENQEMEVPDLTTPVALQKQFHREDNLP